MNNLNSWEFDDLKQDISKGSLSGLQLWYKVKKEQYNQECVKYVNMQVSAVDLSRLKQEQVCEKIHTEMIIVALEIADRLTDEVNTNEK